MLTSSWCTKEAVKSRPANGLNFGAGRAGAQGAQQVARGKHTDVNAAARGAARASGNAVNVNAIRNRNRSVCLGRIGAASAFAAKNGGCSDGEARRGDAKRREATRRVQVVRASKREGSDRIGSTRRAKRSEATQQDAENSYVE